MQAATAIRLDTVKHAAMDLVRAGAERQRLGQEAGDRTRPVSSETERHASARTGPERRRDDEYER